jgi:hypothetical protein
MHRSLRSAPEAKVGRPHGATSAGIIKITRTIRSYQYAPLGLSFPSPAEAFSLSLFLAFFFAFSSGLFLLPAGRFVSRRRTRKKKKMFDNFHLGSWFPMIWAVRTR